MLRDFRNLRLSAEGASSTDEAQLIGYQDASIPSTLLDAKQVARLLHVSESWVREHCNGKEPRLPAMKLGQGKTALVRFHLNDIEEFIQGQRDRARSRAATQRRW
jgi:hypothetical protein